jgi:membrane-associated protease RseP (regulator of RpoE activity)
MRSETKRILFQIALFFITFITTTLAGAEFCFSKSIYGLDELGNVSINPDYKWADFSHGMGFSIPLMLILTVHEFGHYFTAMYHKVKASLPYYIPIPPLPYFPSLLGTMGAVIRLRERPKSSVQTFDIGLAGPLAGFIVALMVTFYGFKNLPEPEYIFQFHPEYEKYGLDYADTVYTQEYIDAYKISLVDSLIRSNPALQKDSVQLREAASQPMVYDIAIGTNLIFWFFEKTVADPERIPNPHEMMHYPILWAAYVALFITCLNLLPIGQLDGGHVVYGLFGYKTHKIIATVFFIALIFYAGLGLSHLSNKEEVSIGIPGFAQVAVRTFVIAIPIYLLFLYICFKGLRQSSRDTFMYALLMLAVHLVLIQYAPEVKGYEPWLLFGLLIGRLVGIQHPPSEIEQPLDSRRVILGWITLLIFVLCFSPAPIIMVAR